MKNITLKAISFLCAAGIALCLCACDADPNVASEKETSGTYDVIESNNGEETKELDGFHAYGTGKIDPVTVNGTKVSPADFALRSHELAIMMAQTFNKPTDLPVDAAVQYALVHVYCPDFYSITNNDMQYRTASEKEIKTELKKQFGTDDFPITKSMLYNPSKKVFEVWIPKYGTNVYYNVDAVNINGNTAEIITTFYNEIKQSTLAGKTTITVKIQDGKPVIAALKSE
jgi:hypothetical protein